MKEKIFATLDYTPLAPLTDSQAGHAISLTSYLPFMFTLLIGVSALLAMVMIVVGGITYMTTDVFSTKSSGRGMMTSAVYGLLFVLSSYMILYTINPDLLSFKLSFVGLKGAEWGGGVPVVDNKLELKNALEEAAKKYTEASDFLEKAKVAYRDGLITTAEFNKISEAVIVAKQERDDAVSIRNGKNKKP
jgi:hypothetical protein